MSGVFARLDWLIGLKIAIGGAFILWSNSTLAQVTRDTTLGAEGSVVTPNVVIRGLQSDRIDGGAIRGANLFHSFREFNVRERRGVYFTNPQGIENILSRVTGANRSVILGRLGVLGNANLFLINPNGIVFGPNATLDVEGSFVASTANSLKFADGTEFNATSPQSTPLLSINVPVGLQFGSNAGSLSIRRSSLRVKPNNSLALVGGNVTIDGGKLIAPSGRVELGGVAGENTVELFPIGDFFGLNFPQGVRQADVSLTNQAQVNVRSSSGGSIAVNAANLKMSGGSQLLAGISGVGSPNTQAGDIKINVTGIVALADGSKIANEVARNAVGKSGSINITTGSLEVTNGAQLSASTSGKGDAGSVNITATHAVKFDGEFDGGDEYDEFYDEFNNSGAFSQVNRGAEGKAEGVTISTGSLELTNGAQLSASTSGKGDAGSVNITATGAIKFDGEDKDGFNSGAFSQVNRGAVGKAGGVSISTGSLELTNGAELSASTSGKGDVGSVNITATDFIKFDGRDEYDEFYDEFNNSAVFSQVNRGAEGTAGGVTISTGLLELTDGAQLSASTDGKGNVSGITINAREAVTFNYGASASSDVETGAVGDAGGIKITAGSLLMGNARLSASTYGKGNVSGITINAREVVTSNNGDALSDVETGAVGDAGGIKITAGSLSMTGGANLSASTYGKGNTGGIIIKAREAVAFNDSFSASSGLETSAVGDAGGIKITAGSLLMAGNARLSTPTFGQGNVSGITINAREAVSFNNGGYAFSGVGTDAVGDAGGIKITAGSLSMTGSANLSAYTFGKGNVGGITINAREAVTFNDGVSVSSSVGTDSMGDADRIKITAGSLSMTGNARLSAITSGKENVDGIIINARNTVSLDGDVFISSNLGSTSAPKISVDFDTLRTSKIPKITFEPRQNPIFDDEDDSGSIMMFEPLQNTIFLNAEGDSGNITINASSLFVTNGAQLTTSNYGQGQAGNINIDARDIVFTGSSSGAFSSIEENFLGNAGTININTNNLTLTNGAQLVASNLGQGSAGDIKIRAANQFLVDGGIQQEPPTGVFAESQTANGGNIELTGNLLFLRRGGLISTISRVEGEGGIDGNVDIRTKFLVAIPRENSDIIAIGSGRSPGSNIQVRSQGIFGTRIRNERTSESDIVATGKVTSNVLDADISTELIELSSKLVDVASLIANSCIARGSRQLEGKFTITGSGGLPERPGEALMSQYTFGTARTVSNTFPFARSPRRPWRKGDPIVEPSGVYRLSSGQLVLSRECL